MQRVLILGAGFGGLELATRLSEEVPGEVAVTLIDQADSFVFGFSKLDVMFGHRQPDQVRSYYRDILSPGVEFRQERALSIDPEGRQVVTDAGTYEADILVVALGADLDPAATPGFVEGGHDFYSVSAMQAVREALAAFAGGRVVVAILGPFFKCPPAPFETVFMLHDYLSERGLRESSSISLFSPLGAPIPVSPESSEALSAACAQRGIDFHLQSVVTSLDPVAKVAHLADGRTVGYDLFLGVPVHKAPDVVTGSGLTVDGWIPVDPASFVTRFPGVYAVGDVTSAPVPRAGVFAEGEAGKVADVIVAQVRGARPPPPYTGTGSCYIEFGDHRVGRIDVNFLGGPKPTAVFNPPSTEITAEKERFAATRRARWFGR